MRTRNMRTPLLVTGVLVTCVAAGFLFSAGKKEKVQHLPERGFGSAQVLLDAVNGSSALTGLQLGLKELEIVSLMKERDKLLSNREIIRALLESEVVYSSELLAALNKCNKYTSICLDQMTDAVKQGAELAFYLVNCMENNRKSFHLVKYYFGVVDKEELKMLKEENKKAGIPNKDKKLSKPELLFTLFDHFRKEITPQESVKGQLPRRVGAVIIDKKGDCDEQAITFAWRAIVADLKARVVFVDYGKTAHAYTQILIGDKKEFEKFVLALKSHYKVDDKLFKKIIKMGTDIEDGTYWFTFDTTGPVPGLRIFPDYDKRTRVVYPNGH